MSFKTAVTTRMSKRYFLSKDTFVSKINASVYC